MMSHSSSLLDTLLARVQALAPLVDAHSVQAEQERRIAAPVQHALAEAGLFNLWGPRSLGGLEADPLTGLTVLEALARLDSSVAWNVAASASSVPFFSWLPEAGVQELFAPPHDVVFSGTLFPPGRAVPVEGGYRVSGRWPFGSGCHGSRWSVGSALILDDETPRRVEPDGDPLRLLVVYRTDDATLLDTWDTLGLRATGSDDIVLDDVFIPEQRTALLLPPTELGAAFQGPLYRIGIWLSVVALAPTALGSARAAIDALIELAQHKTPQYTLSPLRERPGVQAQAARAEALLGAGRAYLHSAVGDAWQTALDGGRPTLQQKMQLQLATTFAIRAAADAVDLVHEVAGTSAIRETQRFQRYFRDVHSVTQHAFGSTARYESVGRLLFGLPPDWTFFAF
ncbi:acyl-CoA dehydrogenase family protein [Caldimonas brevitalea]|uniref:Hydroxylase n=1 Tax=Caldimonas brevitalea TaxID=413882 RepID=A0A0G3BJA0_9BURK|nr:acyl-CoA dehydrogenase family protein [Caldimonas brevitalea]AKJ27446.1 hypothetical protein AAW51_0755 [Caldimonas brevitalea]